MQQIIVGPVTSFVGGRMSAQSLCFLLYRLV
jgi:hypothetical protein